MSTLKYRAAGKSVAGAVKRTNEDSYFIKKAYFNGSEILFAIVADGMGGVGHGMYASNLICMDLSCWFFEELERLLSSNDFEATLEQQWTSIISRTNEILNSGIVPCGGTTLVALLLYNGTYYAASIGDSRIYICEKGSAFAETITTDHSYAQQLVEEGMDEASARQNPMGNRLTRCIGADATEETDPDFFAGDYKEGDSFLLCTDGQWQTLSAEEIAEILQNGDNTKAQAGILSNIALEREEKDNITAIVIQVAEGRRTAKENTAKEPSDVTEQLTLH